MAARRGNKAWLRQQLAKHLGWDAETTESVVEALAGCSGDRGEADALVEAYMGGQAAARQAVQQFLGPPPSAGVQAHQRDESMRQLEQSMAPGGGGSRGGAGGGGARGGGSRPAAEPAQAVQQSAEEAKPLLNMGRNVAVTVKPARKKGGSSSGAGGAAQPDAEPGSTRQLAKPVVNCLRCGKIYDCRSMSGEARRFLDSGGLCSFCGHRVALRYADGTTNAAEQGDEEPAGAAPAAAGAGPSSQGVGGAAELAADSSAAAALELRDRLVQYDRESAKRTTVLDDQSDYYQIDSNAWLTDEERAVLKERERMIAEAEEARRRKVSVTVDLLGRRVILDDDPAASGDGTAEVAAVEAQLEVARAAATARAAAATAAEAALGGGAAAPTALEAVEDKLRGLRITVNPSMAARNFVFLPQQQQQPAARQQQQQPAPGGQQQQARAQQGAGGGAARQSGGGRGGRAQRQRKGAPTSGHSRLQHDDPFLELEVGA